MPAPDSAIILPPPTHPTIRVALEPAHHIINSLITLNQASKHSGYSEWIMKTADSLSPEQLFTNQLVLEGFHYAIAPQRSWPDFPTYLDHLASEDPLVLRDAILNTYASFPCLPHHPHENRVPLAHPTEMLATLGTFLDYLQSRFPPRFIDLSIETEAYTLLKEPQAMQSLIVSHLQTMWHDVVQAEWERIKPMVQASATAFAQIDFASLTAVEAAQLIIGQDVPEMWHHLLEGPQIEQIVFVPSAHLGPYLGALKSPQTLWLLFGARLPQGTQISLPDLNRSELLVRLNALADDTRLRILRLVREDGELCSQDIIHRLDLSQSAASRHLKHLSATGYLSERRHEGAKCYRLNQERIESTLQSLNQFLLQKH